MNMYACIIDISVPHEIKNQRAWRTSKIMKKWTGCNHPKREVVLGAPDKVNIPSLMHDTRLCQLARRTVIHDIRRPAERSAPSIKKYKL